MVDLTVGRHATRIDVAAGRPVTFSATIQVPPGTGKVVATGWDFTGTGTFTASPVRHAQQTLQLRATHTYIEPGTYLPSLRATAQRHGEATNPFTPFNNLDTVRVVVHP